MSANRTCVDNFDCSRLEYCCERDGHFLCCRRQLSVHYLWVVGILLVSSLLLCLTLFLKQHFKKCRTSGNYHSSMSSQSSPVSRRRHGSVLVHMNSGDQSSCDSDSGLTVFWSMSNRSAATAMSAVGDLPPPYTSNPLSSTELEALKQQSARHRLVASIAQDNLVQQSMQSHSTSSGVMATLPEYHELSSPVLYPPESSMPGEGSINQDRQVEVEQNIPQEAPPKYES